MGCAALVSMLAWLAQEPVPVQRPDALAAEQVPEPPPEPTPEAAPPIDTTPLERPAAAAVPPEPRARDSGSIVGTLFDRELADVPIAGAHIELLCSCLPSPITSTSDDDGRFAMESLPAGVYTILVDRGGRVTRRVISLGPGQSTAVTLLVDPPTSSDVLARREAEGTRVRTMLAAGGVLSVGALALAIAALSERAKHQCMFGLEDCARSPRPGLALGLGLGSAALAVASGTLIGVGVHRMRRLKADIAFDDRTVAFVVGSRF